MESILTTISAALSFKAQAHIVTIHHESKKRRQKKQQCQLCNKQLADAESLKRHVRTIHEGQKPKVECEHCSKTYSNVDNLKQHINCKHSISDTPESDKVKFA